MPSIAALRAASKDGTSTVTLSQQRRSTLVISHALMRMPAVPFYIAGAKITSAIPISVLAPTQGLNITAISYCDEIYFGITADPRLVPDPWAIAEGTTKSLLELQAATDAWSSEVD